MGLSSGTPEQSTTRLAPCSRKSTSTIRRANSNPADMWRCISNCPRLSQRSRCLSTPSSSNRRACRSPRCKTEKPSIWSPLRPAVTLGRRSKSVQDSEETSPWSSTLPTRLRMVNLSGLPRLRLPREEIVDSCRSHLEASRCRSKIGFLEHLRYPLHWTRPGRRMLGRPEVCETRGANPGFVQRNGKLEDRGAERRDSQGQVVGSLQGPGTQLTGRQTDSFKSDAPCRAGPFSGSARSVEIFARRRISASHRGRPRFPPALIFNPPSTRPDLPE